MSSSPSSPPESTSNPAARVYILRLWPSPAPDGASAWRASLTESQSGRRLGFAGLEELFVYLMEVTQLTAEVVPAPQQSELEDDADPHQQARHGAVGQAQQRGLEREEQRDEGGEQPAVD